jgi:hypothetical protein
MTEKEIVLRSCVYVLKLEDDCYYVGATSHFCERMAQHWTGDAARFTKLHKPVSIERVIWPITPGLENATTKIYKGIYGDSNVAGGSWCKC